MAEDPSLRPTYDAVSEETAQSLEDLIKRVRALTSQTEDDDSPVVFLYVDEAAELGVPKVGDSSENAAINHFLSAVESLRRHSLFTVLISTQSKAENAWSLSAAQYKKAVEQLHPPLTETPFDCFGEEEEAAK